MKDLLLRLRSQLEKNISTLLGPEMALTNAGACYVALAAEAGLDGGTLNVSGLAGPWLSKTWRGALEDRWQGHGPCILLNEKHLLAASPGLPLPALVGGFGCHEFAHLVATKSWMSNYTVPPPDVNNPQDLAEALREPKFPAARLAPGPTGGHDLAFIRTLLHMAARLQAMGWGIRRDLLGLPAWVGDPYGFAAALDVEIEECWELPVSAIQHLPVPEGLFELWFELAKRCAWDSVPAA